MTAGQFMDPDGIAILPTTVQQVLTDLTAHVTDHAVGLRYGVSAGFPKFREALSQLVFGPDSEVVRERRVACVQTEGGTHALRLMLDFLQDPDSGVRARTLHVSDPAWANYPGIAKRAGFELQRYPYYDRETQSVDFDRMTGYLEKLPAGSVVSFQVSCHNPSSRDLTPAQWRELAALSARKQFVVSLDMAYHGLANDLDIDAHPPRLFADAKVPTFVNYSCSKNMGLYGGLRLGALMVLTDSPETTQRVEGRLGGEHIRTVVSQASHFPARIAAEILTNTEYFEQWRGELHRIREQLQACRSRFADAFQKEGLNLEYVRDGHGLFALLPRQDAAFLEILPKVGVHTVQDRICLWGEPQVAEYTARGYAEALSRAPQVSHQGEIEFPELPPSFEGGSLPKNRLEFGGGPLGLGGC